MASTILSKGFKSMEEFEASVYGQSNNEVMQSLEKADDPMLSSTSGTRNTVFGAETWFGLNSQENSFAAIPKKPFQKSGFRLETSYPAALGTGGVAENGALPDTIKPDFLELEFTLKTIAHTYNDSEIKELRAGGQDDDLGIDAVRKSVQRFHTKTMNKMLSIDTNTVAGTNFESYDRICETSARATADTGNQTDYDIYGFTRTSGTQLDGVVVDGGGNAMTKVDIRNLFKEVKKASGEQPTFFIGSSDVVGAVETLFEDQLRFNGAGRIKVGVNGVQTDAGDDALLSVSMIKGIPLLTDDDISNVALYALNTDYLHIEIAAPTQNIESDNPLINDAFGTKGVFRTVGELVCTKFSAQGKLINITV